MSPTNRGNSTDGQHLDGLNRRHVLKALGSGAVTVPLLSGVASAHKNAFYGCSQVCSDSKGNEAIVKTDTGYECREMNETSNRQNQRWKYDSHCYEVEDGEAIVGTLVESSFCVNPNNCASNYYDTVGDIIDNLSCPGTTEEITIGGDCDVSGTGGGSERRKHEKKDRERKGHREKGREKGRKMGRKKNGTGRGRGKGRKKEGHKRGRKKGRR